MKPLKDSLLEIEDPTFKEAEDRVNPPPLPPLHCMTAGEILDAGIPPRADILGNALFFERGLSAFIAPPGTGKTRFFIQLACSSIAGKNIGPLAVPQRNKRWMYIAGNETSLERYKHDLSAMLPHFPGHEKAIRENLICHVVDEIGDAVDGMSFDRIRATVAHYQATAVGLDPWGDLIQGDSNSDVDMRTAIRSACHAVWSASPTAALALIHHARDGRLNIAQAVGWDKGNFGKGSKAVRAACRGVINMAPKEAEGGDIVLACGKCNDAKPFEPFAMNLVDGVYQFDPDFDVERWMADVEGKRGASKACSIQDIIDHLHQFPDATAADMAARFSCAKSTVLRHIKAATGDKLGYLRIRGATRKNEPDHYALTGKAIPRHSVAHAEELY